MPKTLNPKDGTNIRFRNVGQEPNESDARKEPKSYNFILQRSGSLKSLTRCYIYYLNILNYITRYAAVLFQYFNQMSWFYRLRLQPILSEILNPLNISYNWLGKANESPYMKYDKSFDVYFQQKQDLNSQSLVSKVDVASTIRHHHLRCSRGPELPSAWGIAVPPCIRVSQTRRIGPPDCELGDGVRNVTEN
jgi:hypothetical protein